MDEGAILWAVESAKNLKAALEVVSGVAPTTRLRPHRRIMPIKGFDFQTLLPIKGVGFQTLLPIKGLGIQTTLPLKGLGFQTM